MPIVSNVLIGFEKRAVTFQQNLRKKGARRRVWWHPKLLNNRMYKGYGSGNMMSYNPNTKRFFLDEFKVRNYVLPSMEELDACDLKPYVQPDVEIRNHPRVTEWDYLKKMEETWTPEASELFKETQKGRHLMGLKAGKLGKFGH